MILFSESLGMLFRSVQGLSVGTMLVMWAVRSVMHPNRFHPMLLIMAAAFVLVTEVSYRAGKAAAEKARTTR